MVFSPLWRWTWYRILHFSMLGVCIFPDRPSRPLAAIWKLSLGNPSKVSSRDRKWSLDHREIDQSSAGSIRTSFKSPELRCQNFETLTGFQDSTSKLRQVAGSAGPARRGPMGGAHGGPRGMGPPGGPGGEPYRFYQVFRRFQHVFTRLL